MGGSDAELARRCRQKDPEAWRVLVRRVGPLVYRIAARILGAGAEAEDAAQEALVIACRAFESFDPTRPFEPWFARIAYTTSLKALARRGRPGGPGLDGDALDQVVAGEVSPEQRLATAEASALVVAALERLAPEDRVLVTLTYQEGLSNAEVAQALDMPVGTVKTRLFRARERLRGLLAPLLQPRERS